VVRGVSVATITALIAIVLLSVATGAVLGTETLSVQTQLAPLLTVLSGIESDALLTTSAGIAALLGTVLGAKWWFTGSNEPELSTERPEEVTIDPATIAGAGFDDTLTGITSLDGVDRTRDGLADTAVAVLVATSEMDHDTAAECVRTGDWTDDRIAAAALGETVSVPLLARFRGWLNPAVESQRRLDRTVAAIRSRLDDTEDTGE